MIDALVARPNRWRAATRRAGSRRGITLLELMLVLGLLVIIGAMAYPALHGPFQMQTLRKAGELIRVEWCKARIKAMKTGQIQMFSFEPETGRYRVEPYYTQQDVLETDAQHGQLSGMGNSMTGASTVSQGDAAALQTRELPENMLFVSVEVQADTRALQLQQSNTAAPMNELAQNTVAQTSPILFYPDGTTSDARLALTHKDRNRYVVISLRSLTGVVKVSELVSAEELAYVP